MALNDSNRIDSSSSLTSLSGMNNEEWKNQGTSPISPSVLHTRPSSPFPTPPTSPSPLPSSSSTTSLTGLLVDSPTPTRIPSWPDPSSITLSSLSSTQAPLPLIGPQSKVLSSRSRPKSLRTAKLARFEVHLIDHLAEFLGGRNGRTIESICQASGVQGAIEGVQGSRKFSCWGSASAVAKARQLVDARLSQTPIHILLAVRLSSESSSVTFRLAQSLSKTLISIPPSAPLNSSTAYYIVESDPLPSSPLTPPAPLPSTPASERSIHSFFTSSSGLSTKDRSYIALKEHYIKSVVSELDACVSRNSLVRLKGVSGSQLLGFGETGEVGEGVRLSMDDLTKFKIDGSPSNLLPYFATGLSRKTAERFKEKITDKLGLSMTKETSLVSIKHMDRRRATYARASLDVKGADIRAYENGLSCSGNLALKKCSMLPSKPFLLSITTPTLVAEPLEEGTDLCMKILADKAATSPSHELSAAVQRASWDLDVGGTFEVHIELDPERFTASETEIRWVAKTRFETSDYRATICEVRPHGSREHWFELELTSLVLNRKLADCVGERKGIDEREVGQLVEEFVEWCARIAGTDDFREKKVEEES